MTLTIPDGAGALESLGLPRPDDPEAVPEALDDVELMNGGVWLAGRLDRGHFHRLSDYVNHVHGRILLRDAVLVDRNDPERRQALRDAWIDPFDLDIIGQRAVEIEHVPTAMTVEKVPCKVTALTSSHEIRGTLHLHRDVDLAGLLRADEPPLLVITGATVTSLVDGRPLAEFDLVLVNRRRTFAVMADSD